MLCDFCVYSEILSSVLFGNRTRQNTPYIYGQSGTRVCDAVTHHYVRKYKDRILINLSIQTIFIFGDNSMCVSYWYGIKYMGHFCAVHPVPKAVPSGAIRLSAEELFSHLRHNHAMTSSPPPPSPAANTTLSSPVARWSDGCFPCYSGRRCCSGYPTTAVGYALDTCQRGKKKTHRQTDTQTHKRDTNETQRGAEGRKEMKKRQVTTTKTRIHTQRGEEGRKKNPTPNYKKKRQEGKNAEFTKPLWDFRGEHSSAHTRYIIDYR